MKKIANTKKEVIYLKIEKSRINREKSRLVLNKSFVLYFSFLIVGIIGYAFNYITSSMLNLLVIVGLFILVFGTLPYVITISKEEKIIDNLINELEKK